jgi:hypothetical protein
MKESEKRKPGGASGCILQSVKWRNHQFLCSHKENNKKFSAERKTFIGVMP